jgi:hypothetical protein
MSRDGGVTDTARRLETHAAGRASASEYAIGVEGERADRVMVLF